VNTKTTLNLHNLSKSDIKFKLNRFPDGEVQVTDFEMEKLEEGMNFIAPIRNAEELFLFVQFMEIIHTSVHQTNIIIPYLMGARNDRKMAPGRSVTLFDVLWIIYNSLYPLDRLTFITMHNEEAVRLFFSDVNGEPRSKFVTPYPEFETNRLMTVVFPDEGAEKRFRHLVKGSYLVAKKSRDINQEQSKILKYELSNPFDIDLDKLKIVVIIDDLSDGGGTFKLLSSELDKFGDFKKELYLTHFIQEKGLLSLTEFYNNIYVCDTFRDIPVHDRIHKLKEIEEMI
jgi:ribose-phosphate pyrophosphokinase